MCTLMIQVLKDTHVHCKASDPKGMHAWSLGYTVSADDTSTKGHAHAQKCLGYTVSYAHAARTVKEQTASARMRASRRQSAEDVNRCSTDCGNGSRAVPCLKMLSQRYSSLAICSFRMRRAFFHKCHKYSRCVTHGHRGPKETGAEKSCPGSATASNGIQVHYP